MSEERNLLVGFDLCDDYSQICCINPKTHLIDSVGKAEDIESSCIPTVLAVREDTKEWLYGEDALECHKSKEGVLLEHLVTRTIEKDRFIIYDIEFTAMFLWEKYFKKTLNLLKKLYPYESIGQLVVTVDVKDKDFIQTIYKALDGLGINKDRVVIQNHMQSYLYYALSQKKEIWMNDVGLFEFNERGLHYSQITINRKVLPMVIGVEEKDYSESLNYSILEEQSDKENLSYIFENIAKSAIHKQIVSTIYITGKGFLGSWTENVIKELCVGRRVFKGQNLYSHGACYAAKEIKGLGSLDEFVFLSEGRIKSNVTMKVYLDAKIQEVVLAKAGTEWYEAEEFLEVIPDNEDELQIRVIDILRREERQYLLTLEGLSERPNRTTRLSIETKFLDESTMVFTIKDKGFGMLFPTSNRIWEKRISI